MIEVWVNVFYYTNQKSSSMHKLSTHDLADGGSLVLFPSLLNTETVRRMFLCDASMDLLLYLYYCTWFMHNILKVTSVILQITSGSVAQLLQLWMGTFSPRVICWCVFFLPHGGAQHWLPSPPIPSLCGGHNRKIWLSIVFSWRTQIFPARREVSSLNLGLNRTSRSGPQAGLDYWTVWKLLLLI